MLDDKEWTVEIRLAYTVKAVSADQALGAVLPLLSLGRDRYGPQPEVADYTVRERTAIQTPVDTKSKPDLTKNVYTAREVAEILGISTASVYEKIPGMRIGGSRRYSRAVILEILERGSVPEPARPTSVRYERQPPVRPPKVVSKPAPAPQSPFLTMSELAKTLRLSTSKVKQLLDARKIHYFKAANGRRNVRRDAIEHYLAGGTPREFVEKLIAQAKSDPSYRAEQDIVENVAAEWRADWPEDET